MSEKTLPEPYLKFFEKYPGTATRSYEVPDSFEVPFEKLCDFLDSFHSGSDSTFMYVYDHARMWRSGGRYIITTSVYQDKFYVEQKLKDVIRVLSPLWKISVHSASDIDVYWCIERKSMAITAQSRCSTIVFEPYFSGKSFKSKMERCLLYCIG